MSRRVWVPCFVCAACGSAGGLEDAGFDAGDARDARAPTDARPDAPLDSGPPWEAEVPVLPGELIVHSAEPCAEWRTVEEPRGLPPDDPTPRVLWSFRVEEDPLGYGDTGYSGLYGATLSATGDLWSYGPSQRQPAAVVIRDGRIVARWERTPAHYSLPFAAAPDGAVFYRASRLIPRCEGECPADVIAPLVRAELRGGEIIERSVEIPTNPFRIGGAMALGTRGQVYTMGGVSETEGRPQSLFAVCGDDLRIRWERRFRVSPQIVDVGQGLFVRDDGTVHVQTQTDTWRLDEARYGVELLRFVLGRDGTVVEPPEPERSHQVVGVLGEGLLERETSPNAGASTSLIRWNGEMAWTAPRLGFSAPARVLPNGEVWSQLDGLVVERRDASGALLEADAFFPGWGGLVDSESRFIVLGRDPVARMTTQRVRDGTSSEVLLGRTYPPTFLPVVGTGNASILGPDGTVYIATGDELVALQTNSLPPGLDTCANSGCNWRRDGWVR